MKTMLLTERSLNRCLYPIRKNKHLQFPAKIYDGENIIFECDGFFTSRHFLMIDIISYFSLKKLYEPNGFIPKNPYQKEVINQSKILYNVDEIKELYHSYNSNITHDKKIDLSIKLTEKQIKALPCFEKYNSNRIYEIINDISNFNFRTTYQVRLYFSENTKAKKKFKHCKLENKNGMYKIFNFETIEKKNKNGFIYSREYVINFNTIFGNLFLNNLLSINVDYYDYEKFCKLSETSQFLYRIINTKRNGFDQNDFLISEILNRLNFKNNETNLSMNTKYLKDSLDELKNELFIKNYDINKHVDGKKITIEFYKKKEII
jgi:hypothetical protein